MSRLACCPLLQMVASPSFPADAVETCGPERCKALGVEVRQLLGTAAERLAGLEAKLVAKEEEVLAEHFSDLRKWLSLEENAQSDWTAGGLRCKIRDRMQKLALVPLLERMRQRVDFRCDLDKSGNVKHVLDTLYEHWTKAKASMDIAEVEEGKLRKKLRKMSKIGMDPTKLESEKNESIWAGSVQALEAIAPAVRQLAAFLEEEASPEAVVAIVSMTPAVVARAACDWLFSMCSAELEQLEVWWHGAKCAIQGRKGLWERLQESEGIFIRRIEQGIEELRCEQQRYRAFATFGACRVEPSGCSSPSRARPGGGIGNGSWPTEAAALLSRSASEMRRRLNPIRDSAAWRLADAAQRIQRDEFDFARPPWELVSVREGVHTVCEEFGIPTPQSLDVMRAPQRGIPVGGDLEEIALALMKRMDAIVAMTSDLRDFPSTTACVCYSPDVASTMVSLDRALEGIVLTVVSLSEDLLGVLDEPTEEEIGGWIQRWVQAFKDGSGQNLDSVIRELPMRPDAEIPGEVAKARHMLLAKLRGLQFLVEEEEFRLWVMVPTAEVPRRTAVPPLGLTANIAAAAAADAAQTQHQPRPTVTSSPCMAQQASRSFFYGLSREASPENVAKDETFEWEMPMPPPLESLGSPRSSYAISRDGIGSVAAAAAAALALVPKAPTVAPGAGPRRPRVDSKEMPLARGGLSPVCKQEPPVPAPELARLPSPAPTSPQSEQPLSPGSWSSLPATPNSSRPVTPSWLLPPWPRREMLGRPDTPSTACDDAEVMYTPRPKFIDGTYIAPRASSTTRLKPLRQGPRNAW